MKANSGTAVVFLPNHCDSDSEYVSVVHRFLSWTISKSDNMYHLMRIFSYIEDNNAQNYDTDSFHVPQDLRIL